MNRAFLAALLLSLPHAPAWAADARSDFQICDGYPKPSRSGDGIVSGSFLFGLGSSVADIRRAEAGSFAPLAIAACDRALADPTFKPEFLVRRANLMQAKAYHQASLDAYEEALATLDNIGLLGIDTEDPLYRRGIGLGNRLLRALIFVELDRDAEALAEIESIERDRPYSVSARTTTLKLRLKMEPGLDNHIALLRELAPIHPGAAFEGFSVALNFGRFDDAVEFGSGLAFDLPSTRGNWTIEGESMIEFQLIEAQADFDSSLAYALAATGDLESAARRLLAARERLDIAMAPLPPLEPGKRYKRSQLSAHEARLSYGQRGRALLDRWERLIALRQEAPDLDIEGLFTRISDFPKGGVPVLVDIVARLGKEPDASKEAVMRDLLDSLHQQRIGQAAIERDKFIDLLPRPETPSTQVRFRRAADGWLSTHGGFTRREMDGPDDWTIRFEDNYASHGTVEEYNMLAAATEARNRGYDRILLQSRRLLERTTHTTGMYGSGSFNSGREAQMRVRMIKPGETPQDLAGADWRMLEVDRVLADLADLPQRPER